MLALLSVGWARSQHVARSELAVSLALLVFMWAAWRNVGPGLLMLAPLVARRLSLAFPHLGARSEPRWSRPVGLVVATLMTVLALVSIPGRSPYLPDADYPVELAQQIASLAPGQRVLNDYNVAGLVLFFGGAGTQVAIDGRSDRYGGKYIEDYLDMLDLSGEWDGLLEELAPTSDQKQP